MDKNDIISEIDAMMGTEGSHQIAELIYEYCRTHDYILYNQDGISLDKEKLTDDEFYRIWNQIIDENKDEEEESNPFLIDCNECIAQLCDICHDHSNFFHF